MNAQFKKGVLELIVLESVRQRDMYGYELVVEVSKVVDVNEGTISGVYRGASQKVLSSDCCRSAVSGRAGAGVAGIVRKGQWVFGFL